MTALPKKQEKVARVVPNSPWPTVQLGSLLREPLRNGHSAKSTGTAHGVRTLTLTAVTKGDFSEKNTKITSANPDRVSTLWLESGDILIERSNAPELVGTTRLYRGPSNFAIFPDLIIRVRLNRTADPAYIELVLQSEALRTYFKKRAKGMSGSMPKIDQQTISEAPIPLPPLPDQRRIVAEIEQQFTRLDAGVAALRRTQANLKRYRSAILKAACEGCLVPTEAALQNNVSPLGSGIKRPDIASFESGGRLLERILAERRLNWPKRVPYKEPAAPDVANLPALPEGWIWCMSDAVFSFITSGSRGWAEYYSENGPLFLRMGNLDHENIRLDLKELQHVAPPKGAEGTRTVVQTNDILISITADVGMVGLVPSGLGEAYINQHVALARPLTSICPNYIAYYLCAAEGGWGRLKQLQRGATKVGLGLDDIRAVPVPLPPRDEQIRIVAELERRLSVIDRLEASVTSNLERGEKLRRSILTSSLRLETAPELSPLPPQPAPTSPVQATKGKSTRITPMTKQTTLTIQSLIEIVQKNKGSITPQDLCLAFNVDEDVEKFFELLRECRDSGLLVIPPGRNAAIKLAKP